MIYMKKFQIKTELAIKMWGLETKKLKGIIKIAKIKIKIVEHIKDELTQVIIEKQEYLVIKEVEKKIKQIKIEYLIDLLISLEIN